LPPSPVAPANAESRLLADFTIPSAPGNERPAVERVVEAVRELALPDRRLERLKTAVAEAVMNAIEHGNHNQAERPTGVRVIVAGGDLVVSVSDQGGGAPIPEPTTPDLEAKLAGRQSPRGWGLFLVEQMADEVRSTATAEGHTVEIVMHLTGDETETRSSSR
jgi:anti-sigma regulatory factor (Ser/Thr protein kinase)